LSAGKISTLKNLWHSLLLTICIYFIEDKYVNTFSLLVILQKSYLFNVWMAVMYHIKFIS